MNTCRETECQSEALADDGEFEKAEATAKAAANFSEAKGQEKDEMPVRRAGGQSGDLVEEVQPGIRHGFRRHENRLFPLGIVVDR